jgi:hypothetical protein
MRMLHRPIIELGHKSGSPRLRIPGSRHAVEARLLRHLQRAVVIAARRPVAQLRLGGLARVAVGGNTEIPACRDACP